MKLLFKNIVLVGLVVLSNMTVSFACRCFGVQTISEAIQTSDMIFSGEVLSVQYWDPADTNGILTNQRWKSQIDVRMESQLKTVKLKLDKTYKGWIYADTITITTMVNEAACGYNFQVGERYIVYAWIYDKKKLTECFIHNNTNQILCSTGICTRTGKWLAEEHGGLVAAMKG